ncbi:HDOD domain-containing protein [uncultured Massilia sp.]|uniref:HDOD domain-containing protein n=1 Tax=uncultured Massilia sp. TaxID=169973 RepID=UPI0025EDAFEB|nr:HDOD domain-containing protein [uncultured Massilia sp.]
MKNWIKGLLGNSEQAATAAAADAHAQAESAGAEIDAAYYRWLTASAGYEAPDDVERRILDELRQLARDPAAAAGLVPRVPEVIPQLLASLGDEGTSNADLARQASQDVVLVAEVVREANSAYYRPLTPVKTVEAAIMMLGQNGLRMLLARLAFRPIITMQSSGFARRAAPQVWSQSEKCALAASLMAPGMTAGAFEAYLSGLMQNVGLLVAFRLADRIGQEGRIPGSRAFGLAVQEHGRALSAQVARHWEFPADVCEAIAHAGEPGEQPLAKALALGDRIAKLRLLIDGAVIDEDDTLVTEGLDNFQRRCLNKLALAED